MCGTERSQRPVSASLGILGSFFLSNCAERRESPMRTNTTNLTNRNVLGNSQDRAVVTSARRGCAPAAQHLAFAHACQVIGCWYRGLKRHAKAAVTGAVQSMEQLSSMLPGPQLCRLPVRSTSHASA